MPLSLLRKSFQTMLKEKPRKSQDNRATLSTVLSDRPVIDRNYVKITHYCRSKKCYKPLLPRKNHKVPYTMRYLGDLQKECLVHRRISNRP